MSHLSTDRLSNMAAFVSAVEAGSFTAAAARLHLSRSAVGKRIARLEQDLGVVLFHRTTRSQHLTEAGILFHQRCLRLLAELAEAEDELAAGRDTPTGRLRLTLPVHFGRRCVAPLLVQLAARYPRLQIEAIFSDRRMDLLDEGFDLAIRSGPLPDSLGIQQRPLGMQRMVLCAAPGWLAGQGQLDTPQSLAGRPAMVYGRMSQQAQWLLTAPDGERCSVLLRPRMALDDLDAIRLAAEAGLGLARLPAWLAEEAIASGQLVEVLRGFQLDGIPLQLIWPRTPHVPHKLRVLIDMLVAELSPLLAT